MIGTGRDEKRIGQDDVKAMIQRDWDQSEAASAKLDWTLVSAAGSVAWVAADVTMNVKIGGQESRFSGLRLTAVLEKRGNKWLMMQWHFSAPSATQEEGQAWGSSES